MSSRSAARGLRRAALLLCALVLLFTAVVAAATGAGAPTTPTAPFATGVQLINGVHAQQAVAAGAQVARIGIEWTAVAPADPAPDFDAANPADPQYRWSAIDRDVREAAARHLIPLIFFWDAPVWAQDPTEDQWNYGNWHVDPQALADFATAAAKRYGGSFNGLPRVRYWSPWNEPNLSVYFNPQYEYDPAPIGGTRFEDPTKPLAPTLYRTLLNQVGDAVRAVHADNLVVAGELAPFSGEPARLKYGGANPPLAFMRELLCVSAGATPHKTCNAVSKFDVWAHHPYTSGNAFHHAANKDDVSLGDLSEMKAVLDAATRLKTIRGQAKPAFWIDEFSWNTRPPDAKGVPVALDARWVAEALYQSYRSGVSMFGWGSPCDWKTDFYRGGLWFVGARGTGSCGTAKPALKAFRFPFVAYPAGARLTVWGRTPNGIGTKVRIEQRVGSSWRFLATLPTTGGVFSGKVPRVGGGLVRARVGYQFSLPFSLKAPPDHVYNPFGTI